MDPGVDRLQLRLESLIGLQVRCFPLVGGRSTVLTAELPESFVRVGDPAVETPGDVVDDLLPVRVRPEVLEGAIYVTVEIEEFP
jgi:hypothetical protein